MENQYGNDFVVLTDDDGNEQEFEHLATIDYEGNTYMAFTPYNEESKTEEPSTEVVILKVEEDENGEDILATVDDDELLDAVFEKFLELEDEEEEVPEA